MMIEIGDWPMPALHDIAEHIQATIFEWLKRNGKELVAVKYFDGAGNEMKPI